MLPIILIYSVDIKFQNLCFATEICVCSGAIFGQFFFGFLSSRYPIRNEEKSASAFDTDPYILMDRSLYLFFIRLFLVVVVVVVVVVLISSGLRFFSYFITYFLLLLCFDLPHDFCSLCVLICSLNSL